MVDTRQDIGFFFGNSGVSFLPLGPPESPAAGGQRRAASGGRAAVAEENYWHAIDQHSSQTTTTFCKNFRANKLPWVLRVITLYSKWATNSHALSHMLFIIDNHPPLPRRPSVDHALLSSS